MSKLDDLSRVEGVSVEDLLREGTFDSICKGICTNPNCDYTTEVEPDQKYGYCEFCNTKTVASALILAGMI